MRMNGKRNLLTGLFWLITFAIWTILIQRIDVQPIGQLESEIGFADLNCWFHDMTGVHMGLYVLTDWLGLVPVFVCLFFAGIGFVQLMKRKHFFKVDYDMIVLGIYYCIVIGCYLIFEWYPINYRPVLIEGRLEASYPSSTTLLVLCVMPTLVEQLNRRLENAAAKKAVRIMAEVFSAGMVAGRLFSGVHWFTDIVGAILFSAGLFCIYKGAVLWKEEQIHGIS